MDSDELRKKLIDELEDYQSDFEDELEFKERFITLVKNFTNCASRELKHAHLTGSAWIVNDKITHALMTHHSKLNRWLQLGGHADGELNIKNVALREAQEESGLNSVRLLHPSIFDIDIHEIPSRGNELAHEHFDIRYFIFAEMTEKIQKNHESKNISWIPLNNLNELTDNNRSVLRMSEKTLAVKGKVPLLW